MIKRLLCKLLGHKVYFSREATMAEIEYDLEHDSSWFRCKRCGEFYR
jgi:hypothetical protein